MNEKPVLVKVQREDEDYLEAATKLIKSASDKNPALLILIKTNERKELINVNTLIIKPKNYIEIDSTSLKIEIEIKKLLEEDSSVRFIS